MGLNKSMRYMVYFAIITPIVLAFLPFLFVWTVLDIAKKLIIEFAQWLQKKLKLNIT